MRGLLFALVGVLGGAAALAGCPGPSGSAGTGGLAAQSSATGAGAATCLPAQALAVTSQCVACHSNPPVASAPQPLVTYDDLAATSPKGGTFAARMVARMQDTTSPMPPAGGTPVAPAVVAAFAAWVTAGMPKASCQGSGGSGAGGNPYNTPDQCTSMLNWPVDLQQDFGNYPKDQMHPGRVCIDCHLNPPNGGDTGPGLLLAGTVYPTAHEPDDCFGVDGTMGSLSVEVTDAKGQVTTMKPGVTGDFYVRTLLNSVAFPITAKVRDLMSGKERAMAGGVMTGDCNSCHTLHGSGSPMAPGRIMAPK